MSFSGTILFNNSYVMAVNKTLHIVIGHKYTFSGRLLDKAIYFSNKM